MIERERAEKGGPEQIVCERKRATKDHSGAGCVREEEHNEEESGRSCVFFEEGEGRSEETEPAKRIRLGDPRK